MFSVPSETILTSFSKELLSSPLENMQYSQIPIYYLYFSSTYKDTSHNGLKTPNEVQNDLISTQL